MSAVDVKSFGKVAVLMGGKSAEREVSLMSGSGVLKALRRAAWTRMRSTRPSGICPSSRRRASARCFIALHGRFGEDGTVQGALELLGIPYTGSGVMASSIAIDKVMTKRVWLAEGMPTPRYTLLQRGLYHREQVVQVPDELGLPVIVKPAREGSSIGVTKVAGYSDMQAAVDAAAALDDDVLCEQFISGDEVTCPVLGTGEQARALPVIRIVAPEGNYDYQNKYFTDDTKYLVPCGLPPGEEERHPGAGAQGLPRAGLPRLGPGGRDDRRRHAPALAAGDQHLARHDRPFAGADVGPRGRHQLRRPVRAAAGLGRAGPAASPGKA
jgi:D-alanine-D-alanine ligase